MACMAWENIEERLKKAFKVEISFPNGTVWLPDTHVSIDEWLMSVAETDEELKELDIKRILFLRNRWPTEKLAELEWNHPSDKRVIVAMYVGKRAYILFADGFEYQLIAAIEPRSEAPLYRAVIGKLLQNPKLVSAPPTNFKNWHPDLVPDSVIENWDLVDDFAHARGPSDWIRPELLSRNGINRQSYLSNLLIGWIGNWIDLPVLGYWHAEISYSITTLENGEYVMKYKPTYGDKQREKQRRKKEEPRNRQITPDAAKPEQVKEPQNRENPPERQDHEVA